MREALIEGQELRDFPPLARVAKIGQVKARLPGVLKSGKRGLERRRERMRSGRTVFRTEAEEGAASFRVNIHQVVEFLLVRRLDMAGLQS
jgi:hypothetical protein